MSTLFVHQSIGDCVQYQQIIRVLFIRVNTFNPLKGGFSTEYILDASTDIYAIIKLSWL